MRRTAATFVGRRVASTQNTTVVSRSLLQNQTRLRSDAAILKSFNTGEQRFKFTHLTSICLAVAIPVGLLTTPSALSFPINTLLAFIIPIHAHMGTRNIIMDYVPRGVQGPAVWGLRVASILAFVGLVKINQQSGILEGLKQLWKKSEKKN